ncbi:uncharacterized protein PG998_009908 [Apiospora kogelbergensis]|uniref:Uncharacterized protein n=1 Tax=Apiospora kogelbergensis TaxID=1337665 RepID=A0AAW0R9C0_9PEZI
MTKPGKVNSPVFANITKVVTAITLCESRFSKTPAPTQKSHASADYEPSESVKEEIVELTPQFETGKISPLFSDLPYDSGSITTLPPIHEAIPYHLAFYHLDWARRKMKVWARRALIPELSCHGTSTIKSVTGCDVPCTWSSDIYYYNGDFLQKQELMYTMDMHRIVASPTEDKDGLISVSTNIQFPPGRWQDDKGDSWSSAKGGSKKDIHRCSKCHSDLGYHVEVVDREVRVRFTCCRNLGNATTRSEPKWQTLLTGEGFYGLRHAVFVRHDPGYRNDRPSTYRLYKTVLETAKHLGRPNLYRDTYETVCGDFSVG